MKAHIFLVANPKFQLQILCSFGYMTKNVKYIDTPENNFLCIFIIASSPGVHTFFCPWSCVLWWDVFAQTAKFMICPLFFTYKKCTYLLNRNMNASNIYFDKRHGKLTKIEETICSCSVIAKYRVFHQNRF